jgi:hypothetical protein
MYIVVSSSDSKSYYKDNKATRFRVKLSKPINLEGGDWYVGVCDIHLTDNDENKGVVGFNADICNGLMTEGSQTHLLRKFNCKRNVHEAFPIIYYLPVGKLFIDNMEFYLTSDGLEDMSLADEAKLEVTLHFVHNVSSIRTGHVRLD